MSLAFKENYEIYEETRKSFGKNILFTDDLSLTSKDIVKIYSSKNIIEEQFKTLKNPYVISFTPMWCWTDKMIRVHAFTCVMALLFLRIMVKKVKESGLDLSQEQILEQLKKIKLALTFMSDSSVNYRLTRLNDIQRKLVDIFNLKEFV